MTEKKLAGKVAIVTGGARGLGRGYALRMAKLGADVAVIDRNLHAADVYEFEKSQLTADTVMAECEALGVRAIGLEVDLTDRKATQKAVADVVAQLGHVDVCVCNAGGGVVTFADERTDGANDAKDLVTTGTPSDCSDEMLDRVLSINLRTCMNTCMAVAPYMKQQKSGKIVTVASTAGWDGRGRYFPYGTAKAAIMHYTRALANELAPFNVHVNNIAPGSIRTGRLGDRSEETKTTVPMGREGTIEECANVVEFFTTSLSDYVTGRSLLVDGGKIR